MPFTAYMSWAMMKTADIRDGITRFGPWRFLDKPFLFLLLFFRLIPGIDHYCCSRRCMTLRCFGFSSRNKSEYIYIYIFFPKPAIPISSPVISSPCKFFTRYGGTWYLETCRRRASWNPKKSITYTRCVRTYSTFLRSPLIEKQDLALQPPFLCS